MKPHIKIKIGLFVDGSFLPSREGATRHIYLLAKHLNHIGVDVVVFHCYRGWSDVNLIQKESFTTFLLGPDDYYNNPGFISRLVRIEKINILQMCDPTFIISVGLPVRLFTGIKLIWEVHEIVSDLLRQLASGGVQKQRTLEVTASKFCDKLICFTSVDRLILADNGIPKEKITTFPCGVDILESPFFGPNLDALTILYLGNMYYEPNLIAARKIVDIIQPHVCARINRIRFKLVGTAPQDLIQHSQDENLLFTGPLRFPHEIFSDVTLAIAPVDVCSGMRIKLLDYMAAGLPIVSTSWAAVGILHEGSILLENKTIDFADRIIELIQKHDFCVNLGIRNRRQVARHHNWATNICKLMDLYEEIINNTVQIPLPKDVERHTVKRLPIPFWLEETIRKRRFPDSNKSMIKLPSVIRNHELQSLDTYNGDPAGN